MAMLSQGKQKAAEKIYSEIDRLEGKIEYLKRSRGLQFSKQEAKTKIQQAIQKFKENRTVPFDSIDLHHETPLSYPEINEIMEELEKEGKVREHEE
jgi:hypothetical protein